MEAASSHRLAMSWKQQAAKPGATVAARRETIKAGLYDPLCSASATTFFPVAMETLGAIGPESLLFLREVGRRIPGDHRRQPLNDLPAATTLRRRSDGQCALCS